MIRYILACGIFFLTYSDGRSQSIQDLDFLLGKWQIREVIFANTEREYVETGVRECSYYLDSTYIKCETNAIRKGQNRTYVFLFNYDQSEGHFRLLKIFGDYSFFAVKSWKMDGKLNVILETDISGDQYIGDIDFTNKNQLVWRGWSPKPGKEPKLELLFTEKATRL